MASEMHQNEHGVWVSGNSIAVDAAIKRGSMDELMSILVPLEAKELASTLRQSGFVVHEETIGKGRNKIFLSVQHDLVDAIGFKVNGYELDDKRNSLDYMPSGIAANSTKHYAVPQIEQSEALDFTSLDFTGDIQTLGEIQDIMRSETVMVELLGDDLLHERASLNFIASQGLQKRIQAFGFEEIAGKYLLDDASIGDVRELYGESAKKMAETAVRQVVSDWKEGKNISGINEYVPPMTQRILHSPVTLSNAENLVEGISSGIIGNHAKNLGLSEFGQMMREQGIDVNQPTVNEQAANLGLQVISPDVEKGQYIGPVIAVDHRSALVKCAQNKAVILNFKELPNNMEKVNLDDTLSMRFANGELRVTAAKMLGKTGVER